MYLSDAFCFMHASVHLLKISTRGKIYVKLSTNRDGSIISTETRKGWKHKKIILLQKTRGKERLKDNSTSVAE